MELSVAADIAVDLATKDDLDKHHRKLAEVFTPPRGRVYRPWATASTTSGFSGSGPIYLTFDPPRPPAGRMWLAQWVAIWVGTSPAAGAVANLFAAFAIGRAPVGANASFGAAGLPVNVADVVIPGQAVPSSINIPDKTQVGKQDAAYVILQGSGLAASTIYNATLGVLEMDDKEEAFFW